MIYDASSDHETRITALEAGGGSGTWVSQSITNNVSTNNTITHQYNATLKQGKIDITYKSYTNWELTGEGFFAIAYGFIGISGTCNLKQIYDNEIYFTLNGSVLGFAYNTGGAFSMYVHPSDIAGTFYYGYIQ